MAMQFHIRDAVEGDLQPLWKFQMAMTELHGLTNVRDLPILEFREDVFGPEPIIKFMVCEMGNELVGFISFYFGVSYPWGKVVYIEDIFVNEEHRKSGIGKSLLQAATSVALKKGCRLLMLHCATWNESALSFYEHLGMEHSQYQTLHFELKEMKKFCSE